MQSLVSGSMTQALEEYSISKYNKRSGGGGVKLSVI